MTAPKLTPSTLAALLCARICHDLVSPVGALGTAIEILDDDSNADMHDDALDLVRSSAKRATAKLKFLRLAFGAAGSAPGIIATEELTTLSENMFADAKAELEFAIHADGLDKSRARLLLNLIMLGVQSVPRGGTVRIETTDDAMRIISSGPRARLDENVARALSGRAPEDGFDGRTIQPFYAGMMAREQGGSAQSSLEGEAVTFRVDYVPAA
jgi:histidine phosphotransferase ChpT